MFRASVVIPTYDRPDLLCRTLLSLNSQRCDWTFEVLVVDDGSASDLQATVHRLSLRYPWRYFRQPHTGFGAARARNMGIGVASAPVVIFLDDDMIVPDHFVQSHLESHDLHPGSVFIGLRRRVPRSVWTNPLSKVEADWPYLSVPDPRLVTLQGTQWRKAPWAFFSTSNASAPKEFVVGVGSFDEGFSSWGFEDTDLAFRMFRQGVPFRALIAAIPYHLEPADQDPAGPDFLNGLTASKHSGYLKGLERILAKYPDDPLLHILLSQDRLLRELAVAKAIPSASTALQQGRTELPELDRRPGAKRAPLPCELSLLTPYSEKDEETLAVPRVVPWVPDLAAHRADSRSLYEQLEEAQAAEEPGGGGVRSLVWAVLMTPPLFILCIVFFGALVVTGRYQRLFRA